MCLQHGARHLAGRSLRRPPSRWELPWRSWNATQLSNSQLLAEVVNTTLGLQKSSEMPCQKTGGCQFCRSASLTLLRPSGAWLNSCTPTSPRSRHRTSTRLSVAAVVIAVALGAGTNKPVVQCGGDQPKEPETWWHCVCKEGLRVAARQRERHQRQS